MGVGEGGFLLLLDLELERDLPPLLDPWRPAPPPLPLAGVVGVGGLVAAVLDLVILVACVDELLVVLWSELLILC